MSKLDQTKQFTPLLGVSAQRGEREQWEDEERERLHHPCKG